METYVSPSSRRDLSNRLLSSVINTCIIYHFSRLNVSLTAHVFLILVDRLPTLKFRFQNKKKFISYLNGRNNVVRKKMLSLVMS